VWSYGPQRRPGKKTVGPDSRQCVTSISGGAIEKKKLKRRSRAVLWSARERPDTSVGRGQRPKIRGAREQYRIARGWSTMG